MVDGTIGPSEHVGDILDENPDEDTTRIYVQNLNGLNWNKDGGRWPYVCEAMSSLQVDIACFSEINTDTNRYEVRRKMESICQQHFEKNCLVMASSSIRTTTTYKPGGTAILAGNTITTRICKHTRDRLGRWASICLQLSSTKRLRIISAYQVCSNSRPGTITAASQQMAQSILERSGNSLQGSNPRQLFIHDLHQFIKQSQQNEELILLVGDFNEDIAQHNAGMNTLATTCGLIDLFSLRLGTTTNPITYQRGTKRLDYILISPGLFDSVQAAGYDPFGYRIPSDHRGMFVDFSTSMLFDNTPPEMPAVAKREFKTSSPGVIPKYVTAKIKYLMDHKIFERLHVLENLQEPNHALAEAIDRDLQRASYHAARKCTVKPKPPWSPQLASSWAELHYYRLLLAASKSSVNFQPAIQKLREQWHDLPDPYQMSVEEIQEKQRQALATLKYHRSVAQQLREAFLLEQYGKSLAADDTQKARIIQRLLRAEKQHQVYMKLRSMRQRDQQDSSLTSLKIPRTTSIYDVESMKRMPDNGEHWETITVPHQVEQMLLKRNRHHFSQAEGTPFTQSPITADVGYKADGVAAELILAGQIQYNNTDKATNLFIKHLQRRTVQTLDGTITRQEILQKLKRWNETTTTSPSGLHLGHYHCSWKDPKMPVTDPNREVIIQHQKSLLQATVTLLNYAIKFAHTFERWTKIVNVMLLKDPGNPRIHRLRVIHIYEADYNMLLAVKWRQALHHAEDLHLLNDGLYGSRPGRSAHDPALMEVLQNEIYRMSMYPGINYDLDATSCYDRILASVAVLSSQRMGMSPNVTQVNAITLEQSKYYLKTQLGVTKDWYAHSPGQPIHGTGQGSGNSPTIWCFVCSTLFDAFESEAHGATFTDYHNQHQLSIHMVGFVDDCTQRVNVFGQQPPATAASLIPIMEKDAQLWNDLLWSSGGALEQNKCSYHLIESQWNSHGQPFLTGGTTSPVIHISHRGTRIPTKQKSNYDAHKTLGSYINPAYTRHQSWKSAKEKNDLYAGPLESNFLTRQEAWTFYTSFYLPSLTYPLPITPLTKSQCDQLDMRFLRSLLPRCGYNRNMSRAIRYGPYHAGGAGYKELYTEQGALLLQHVYKYFNSPDTAIGQILLMTASWTQAFLGTSKFFLTEPNHPIPPTGSSFLLDVRLFLQEIQGSITLESPPIPIPLRQGDRSIMDIAMHQSRWKPHHLMHINACRRYLQSQMLSDITTLSGTRLQNHVFTGTPSPSPTTLRISMFNQPSPPGKAWRTWRRFLRTICDSNGVLVSPLGSWIVDVRKVRHWPKYLYSPDTDTLMSHRRGQLYYVHERIRRGCFSAQPSTQEEVGQGIPTDAQLVMGTLRPICNGHIEPPSPTYILPLGLSVPTTVEPWEKDLLNGCHTLVPPAILQYHFRMSEIIMCSDGSVTTQGGSYGLVAATASGLRLMKGNGVASGGVANSFRSEAYGVLVAIRWLKYVCPTTQADSSRKIVHYLDNQSVIRRVHRALQLTRTVPNSKLLPDQDVIEEIVDTIRKSPFRIELEWIQGHQDESNQYNTLSLPAQLNCDADKAASEVISHGTNPLFYSFPSTPCQLRIQGHTITSHLKRRVHHARAVPRLRQYIAHRFHWGDKVLETVDWTIHEHIIKKYKDRWTSVIKHLYGISPTGKIAHRNNRLLPHECPTCMTPYETNHHVIQCPHQSRAKWRADTIRRVLQHSADEVDPYLQDILRDGLTRYHRDLNALPVNDYPSKYDTLIGSQNQMGWDQLYRGRWSKEWQRLQDEYTFNSRQSTLNGKTWILNIGRILIDQWLKLWEQRNADRHHRDNVHLQERRRELLHNELRQLYTCRMRVCPFDRRLFYDSMDSHLQHHSDLDALEEWIQIYRPVINASMDQAIRLGTTHNSSIIQHLTHNPIPRATTQVSLTADKPGG